MIAKRSSAVFRPRGHLHAQLRAVGQAAQPVEQAAGILGYQHGQIEVDLVAAVGDMKLAFD